MRELSVLFVLFAELTVCAPTLRIGSAIQKPHAYPDSAKRPQGFFVEVLSEAARRAGYSPEWVFREESLENAMVSGAIDVYGGGFATPERRLRFYFTASWWREQYYIVAKADGPVRHSSDLLGRLLLYELRPPLPVPLSKLLPGVRVKVLASRAERLEEICGGKADAALFNDLSLHQLVGARPEACKNVSLRIVPQSEIDTGFSIVSLPERRNDAEAVRDAIAAMALDGSLAALARRFGMFPFQSGDLAVPGLLEAHPYLLWAFLSASLIALCAFAYGFQALRKAKARGMVALASAERASLAKEAFLATMSHEIRTPMNAVLGYLDLLQETQLRPEQEHFANDMRGATRSLLSLLTDILEFSKLRSGAITLLPKSCGLAGVVEDVARGGALAAEAKNLEFIVRIDPKAPQFILADGVRLQQILTNLVANAIKFTHSGYVRLNLEFHAPAAFEITVTDTGIGIAADKLGQIFEPFRQIDSSDRRRYGGIGLGLSIVRELVEAMRGSVDVESKPGFGSRFRLLLPIAPAPQSKCWIEEFRDPATARVAIVAAESGNLAVLREYFAGSGIQAACFGDAAQAKDSLKPEMAARSGIRRVYVEAGAMRDPEDFIEWARALNPLAPPLLILIGTITGTRLLRQSARDRFDGILTWPVCPSALKAPGPSGGAREPGAISQSVLVVDDNPINRRVATALFVKMGCIVETAEDGRIALEKCRNASYGLVLMDCQMPNMDGFESAQHIRALGRKGTHLPIYGTSASTEMDTERKCLAAGMDGYLPKPIGLRDLEWLMGKLNAADREPPPPQLERPR